jgi:outer membrane immunogenic protein
MKTTLAATAAILIATTAASSAADMAVKAPMVAPAPVFSWTGFYAGLNAGATWGNNNDVNVASVGVFNPAGFVPDIMNQGAAGATTNLSNRNNDARFIGGAQIGYNWQAANWVYGIEADIQGIANNNTNFTAATSVMANNGSPIITTLNASQKIDYLGTVRGRLGFLATPTFLFYGTGGLAYGQVASAINITQSHAGPDTFGSTSASFSQTRAGWTAGAGLEWLFAPKWSVKFEYLYYDLGDVSYNAGALQASFTNGFVRYAISPEVSTRFNGNIVRAGVNYHF